VPELTVVDEVDADGALARDHVGHGRAQSAQVLRFVGEISGRGRLPAWLVKIRSGISPP
jgi:hypothetical protein